MNSPFTPRPVPDAARDRIAPRIDTGAFGRLVAGTPYLSSLQREFLTGYFSARSRMLFGV